MHSLVHGPESFRHDQMGGSIIKPLLPRGGPSDLTLRKVMAISIGSFVGLMISILTIHYFVRRAKRRRMGLPTRSKRKKPTREELEAHLPPPDLNAVAAQMGPNWQGTNAALRPAPRGVLSPTDNLKEAGPSNSAMGKPNIVNSDRVSGYDFTKGGQRRIEIIPQRPPRPDSATTPDATHDFKSILIPSPLPSPRLPFTPTTDMNPRGWQGGMSSTQSNYSPVPSPSLRRYQSPFERTIIPHEPPPITPKSPRRNVDSSEYPPPRSPPPSSPPPPIPAFLPTSSTSYSDFGRSRSASVPSGYNERNEASYQDSHYYRQSISSTNVSGSSRPSDDASSDPTLIKDSERRAVNGSMKRKGSRRLRKNESRAGPGHRRTKTQEETIQMSNIAIGEGLRRITPSPELKEGGKGSKASSMVLQFASGWDPDSSSEDNTAESGKGGKKKKRKKGKGKDKEKDGKHVRGW